MGGSNRVTCAYDWTRQPNACTGEATETATVSFGHARANAHMNAPKLHTRRAVLWIYEIFRSLPSAYSRCSNRIFRATRLLLAPSKSIFIPRYRDHDLRRTTPPPTAPVALVSFGRDDASRTPRATSSSRSHRPTGDRTGCALRVCALSPCSSRVGHQYCFVPFTAVDPFRECIPSRGWSPHRLVCRVFYHIARGAIWRECPSSLCSDRCAARVPVFRVRSDRRVVVYFSVVDLCASCIFIIIIINAPAFKSLFCHVRVRNPQIHDHQCPDGPGWQSMERASIIKHQHLPGGHYHILNEYCQLLLLL